MVRTKKPQQVIPLSEVEAVKPTKENNTPSLETMQYESSQKQNAPVKTETHMEQKGNQTTMIDLVQPSTLSTSQHGVSQQDMEFKMTKIQCMFVDVDIKDIQAMLEDCYYNEDEVILRMITQHDYLIRIQQARCLSKDNNDNHDTDKGNTPIMETSTTESITSHSSQPSMTGATLQNKLSDEQSDSIYVPPLPENHHQPPFTTTLPATTTTTTIPSTAKQDSHSYYRPLQPLLPSSPSFISPILKSPTRSNKGKKYKKRQPPPLQPSSPVTDDNTTGPSTPIPSSSPIKKPRVRSVGRLALDDALQQVKENPGVYEGWSEARLRAYRMIDTNPNSYYYRFNAPGEEQHKGAWTKEEKQLFLDRLKQVGANAQWGVFAMAVPGRVGYQCSNFYRLLIETGEIYDKNYVLDEKGKAHYLFDKKTASGDIEKTFRTHCRHGSKQESSKRKQQQQKKKSDDDSSDGEYTDKPYKSKKKGTRRSKRHFGI
ncbi:uncharacterized protein BX664DRAFT_343544 [Halteromyces radiatus]|uniref:uncharacterized protein n=1 Tax=Halteromyces radiatus TaxID=101107 RepID=UPI002220FC13|nr:uncharacterized protein BX664DRAFT_343544 [Halteromyces radiatus]KAI8077815.1 hypothetical protein BX664DRAFT_343544 [Halteromyces radiatus]